MSEKKTKKTKAKKAEEPPAEEAPAPAPAAEEPAADKPAAVGPPKKKIGNVFALFNQQQIQEFKEAFTMMDINRDGYLDQADLMEIWGQTGREADAKVIDAMIAESPGQLNFTNFLTLFGEKMHGTDSETALREAFVMFDPEKTGKFDEKWFKDMMVNVGDQFTKEEIKLTWKEAPIESGKIDYLQLVKWIKHGKEGEE